MALTPEWTRRVDSWRREIRTHCYRPLGRVDLAGFVTADWLGPEVVRLDAGGEGLLIVNGRAFAALDRQHDTVTPSRVASTGARFELPAEVHAGHGPLVVRTGPVAPGRLNVPEPGPTQAVVGESTFGLWEEEVHTCSES